MHKDILGLPCGKIIGAWVDAREETRKRGLTTVSSPPQKRLGLSHVSLSVAALSHTSDSLHLCLVGGWVSAMGFRRPMYSLFQKAYGLVDTLAFDPNRPKLVPLPRLVAQELVLAAILHPLMMTDIGSIYHDQIFATDASQHKGAVCSMPISPELSEIVWKTSRSKGSYTRLQTPAEIQLRRLGIAEESDLSGSFSDDPSPPRPLAYRFDFIEVYAGAAKISSYMVELGFSTGPPLDLSLSEEYDLRLSHVLAWLTYLVTERLVLAIMLEPPCTTYSIIRRPALRSKDVPFGFCPHEEKTMVGNQLAARACQVFYIASINFVAAMLETPYSSLLKHLPFWKAAASLDGVKQVRVDSCRFGSPHLKSFRMLCAHVQTELINLKCVGQKPHLQVQGKYTKGSATYTDSLSLAIATTFVTWISAEKKRLADEATPTAKGLESCAINNLAIAGHWKVDSSWTFRRESHINILEEAALLRLVQRSCKLCYPTRITVLVDSNVVRGATAKGRSSSLGLSTVLRRLNAICVAAGIYLHIAFVPTRLNIADDPTRDRPLRAAGEGIDLSSLSREELFEFFLMHRLKRWASNWARLILRIVGVKALRWSDRSCFRSRWTFGHDPLVQMDFDSTCGFPGEGPCRRSPWSYLGLDFCSRRALSLSWLCPLLDFVFWARMFLFWFFTVVASVCMLDFAPVCVVLLCPVSCRRLSVVLAVGRAMAMPVLPATAGEFRRAGIRSQAGPLPEGRPVQPLTGSTRERYLRVFREWSFSEGIDLDALLENSHVWVEEINIVLCCFGRQLFEAGKTYNQYAETINSITSIRPSLRRQMQGAWDLGYAWMRQEPSQHHIAMPGVVVLAMISTALMWGWLAFAGALAIGWGSLLRPGEIFGLQRRNLLFPSDCGNSVSYCLVSLMEPKTRFTAARHQSTRLDIPDLLQVATLAFEKLEPTRFIWPFSPQTFRNRFKAVLAAIGLPTEHTPSIKALDPGSLRAGGASWLMQVTDSGDIVRRRGRWQNQRIMEVYVQEVGSLLYLQFLDPRTRQKVIQLASHFLTVLDRASSLESAKIPHNIWFLLYSSWKMPWADGEKTGVKVRLDSICGPPLDHSSWVCDLGHPSMSLWLSMWTFSPWSSCGRILHAEWKKEGCLSGCQYPRLLTELSCSRFPPTSPLSLELKFDLIQSVAHLWITPLEFVTWVTPLWACDCLCGPSALDQAVAESYTLNGKRKAAWVGIYIYMYIYIHQTQEGFRQDCFNGPCWGQPAFRGTGQCHQRHPGGSWNHDGVAVAPWSPFFVVFLCMFFDLILDSNLRFDALVDVILDWINDKVWYTYIYIYNWMIFFTLLVLATTFLKVQIRKKSYRSKKKPTKHSEVGCFSFLHFFWGSSSVLGTN